MYMLSQSPLNPGLVLKEKQMVFRNRFRVPACVCAALIILICAPYTFAETWEWSFSAGEYTVVEKNGSHLIEMEGFSSGGSPGDPVLPHRVFNIALPPLTDPATVSMNVTGADTEELEGTYSLMPAPPCAAAPGPDREAIVLWGEGKKIVNGRNMNVYGSDDVYPSETLELLPCSQKRKWKFARVRFTPFKYNPATGRLVIVRSVSCTLTFAPETVPGEPVSAERKQALNNRLVLLRDSVMDREALGMFYNPIQAQALYSLEQENIAAEISRINAGLAQKGIAAGPEPKPSAVYDYVIITTSTIQGSLTKLSTFTTHLTSLGFSPLVVDETSYSGLTGQSPNGTAEKIRQWLINNYASYSIQYVLLIGDPDPDDPANGSDTVGDVPMKMMWPRQGAGTYEESPTDYFYADLTGNWNLDSDTYFGEYSGDRGTGGVDFAQEVYVGRIACVGANYSAVDSILQKTIDYDTETGDLSWRDKILLPMAMSSYANENNGGSQRTDGLDVPEEVVDNYANAAGLGHYVFYERTGVNPVPNSAKYNNGSDLTISSANVVGEWQNHYGCVFWWGHGSQTSTSRWIWSADSNTNGIPETGELVWSTFFASGNCSSLSDTYPSIVYQCSCLNGYPENAGNLGYELLKHGAVATVSASRVSWYVQGTWSITTWPGLPDNTSIGYTFFKNVISDNDPVGIAVFQSRNLTQLSDDTSLTGHGWMNRMDFNLYGAPHVQRVVPDIVTDTPSVSVDEGSTNTFQVKLSEQPATPSVSVTVSNTAGDADITVTGGSSLTFTTSNWNTYQTVTLSAAEDADTTDGSATITCSSPGANNRSVTASESDDDFTLTVNNDGNGTTTPSGAVVRDQDASPYSISAAGNTGYQFVNWTVTAGSAAFGDANSAGTTVSASADVTVQANFTPYIETDADTVSVPEGGGANVQVRLSVQPGAGVTVNASVTSGDSDITISAGSSLSFTAVNWNTYQTVTLSAAEDGDSTNGTAVVTLTASGYADKPVTARETDNDSKSDDDDGGCGCSTSGRPGPGTALVLVLIACAVLVRRGAETRVSD